MEYNDVHKDLDKTCRSIKSQPHIVELKEESEGNSKSATQLIKLMLYPNLFHYTRQLEMNAWSQLRWLYSGSKKPYFHHKSNCIA